MRANSSRAPSRRGDRAAPSLGTEPRGSRGTKVQFDAYPSQYLVRIKEHLSYTCVCASVKYSQSAADLVYSLVKVLGLKTLVLAEGDSKLLAEDL